jgi:hypothetical protein
VLAGRPRRLRCRPTGDSWIACQVPSRPPPTPPCSARSTTSCNAPPQWATCSTTCAPAHRSPPQAASCRARGCGHCKRGSPSSTPLHQRFHRLRPAMAATGPTRPRPPHPGTGLRRRIPRPRTLPRPLSTPTDPPRLSHARIAEPHHAGFGTANVLARVPGVIVHGPLAQSTRPRSCGTSSVLPQTEPGGIVRQDINSPGDATRSSDTSRHGGRVP